MKEPSWNEPAYSKKENMDTKLIKREGSYYYVLAYKRLVAIFVLICVITGLLLGAIAVAYFNRILAGFPFFGLVTLLVVSIWLIYALILWVFKREARESVEITEGGIHELIDGQELVFIPWEGIKEIELAATAYAGASLRVKGSFSEISVSNIDLVISGPESLRHMHSAFQDMTSIRDLFLILRAKAPCAEIRLNKLAIKRLSKDEWVKPRERCEPSDSK